MTLPKGWIEAELQDALTGIRTGPFGSAVHKHDYVTGGTPLINPMHIVSGTIRPSAEMAVAERKARDLADFALAVDDVVLGRRGEMGRCAVVTDREEGWLIGTGSMALTPSEAITAVFLQKYLSSEPIVAALEGNAVGSTMVNLNQSILLKLPIALPPAAEQRRIVAKLNALTARIARARAELNRVPMLAERQRLSILRAGVTGALTDQWHEHAQQEPVAQLLARVPEPKQGRGGREATDKIIPGSAGLAVNNPGTSLPTGWLWVPLLRIAKQETGHTPSRSHPDYWDGGVPWIGIRDAGAHHGRFIDETMQTISEAGLANSSARLLPAGTVCLSRTASVGYVTIMARTMATSQDFATWTCTEALVPEYLMYALMAEGDDIRKFGMGSTHTTIYFPEVRAFHIALPPVEEQREIVRLIKTSLAQTDRLEAEAIRARALLDRLESAILAKAFRGELVPQDDNDEPADVLLERIRAQRAVAPKKIKVARHSAAG